MPHAIRKAKYIPPRPPMAPPSPNPHQEPGTGLPMPFISYGGSSLMLSAFSIGVLLNISASTDLHPRMTKEENVKKEVLEPETGLGKVY